MAYELDNFEAVVNKLNQIDADLARTSDLATRKLLHGRLRDANKALREALDKIKKAADAGDPEAQKFVSGLETLNARSK